MGMTGTRLERLLAFGLLAAPLAWTVQLLFGFGTALAACGPVHRSFSLDVWELAITASAVAFALSGQAAAVLAWRETRNRTATDPPPAGRMRFLTEVALLANTVFVVVIVLGGVGAVHLATCRQA
jgi:hypothetical protein